MLGAWRLNNSGSLLCPFGASCEHRRKQPNPVHTLFLRSLFRRCHKVATEDYQPRHVRPIGRKKHLPVTALRIRKIQFWVQPDKNNGHFTCRLTFIYDYFGYCLAFDAVDSYRYKSTSFLHAIYMIPVPLGRAIYDVGLRPLACWDHGFESRQGYGFLTVVCVLCCRVEYCATGWSPVQCGVSEYDLETSTMRRVRPTGGWEGRGG